MAQIHALTPEGRLPSQAQAHVKELRLVDDVAVPTGADWNTFAPGRERKVTQNLSAADAEAVHAPRSGRWIVRTMEILPNALIQLAWLWSTVGNGNMYYRAYSNAGWTGWDDIKGVSATEFGALVDRVAALESAPAPTPTAPPAPASGFKTVGLPVTAGHSGSNAPLSGTYRIPLDWVPGTVPVTRAKVRLRNINIRTDVTRAGTISLDGIWIGTPDGSGHFATAPQQVAPAVTFDGATGYESPWFDVAGQSLTDKAISYAYTATSAPWGMLAAAHYDPDQVGGSTGNTGFSTAFTAAFAVDLIVETYATTPVIAVIGDSNSVGVGASYMRDAWGVKLAQQIDAIPQLLGSSGDTMQASIDGARFKWTRFAGHTPADAALVALGQNDAAGIQTLATIEGYAEQIVGHAATVGHRVYGVSLMPRNSDDPEGDFESRRRTISSWYEQQRWGTHGFLDIVPAMSADDATILPEYDADGTHLNTAGFQAVADRIASTYRVTAPAPLYA